MNSEEKQKCLQALTVARDGYPYEPGKFFAVAYWEVVKNYSCDAVLRAIRHMHRAAQQVDRATDRFPTTAEFAEDVRLEQKQVDSALERQRREAVPKLPEHIDDTDDKWSRYMAGLKRDAEQFWGEHSSLVTTYMIRMSLRVAMKQEPLTPAEYDAERSQERAGDSG